MRLLHTCLLGVIFACAAQSSQQDTLREVVTQFNENLRWKRFDDAAKVMPQAEQAAFLQRSLADEELLAIHQLEIRALALDTSKESPTAEVKVLVEYNLLPSTVVKKKLVTEKWEQRGRAWFIVEGGKVLDLRN